MENVKDKIQNPAFLLFLLYFTVILVLSVFWEKGTFLLWLNARHNEVGDIFFRYVTYLGDIWLYAIVALFMLGVSYYRFIILLFTFISQVIIVQSMKILVFDYKRPVEFIANSDTLFNKVEGVELLSNYSFPSSHTATAFALATYLICFSRNRLLHVFLMLAAILVAVSRVYILQHFLMDTCLGAFIGVSVSLSVWWYFTHKKPELIYNKVNYHTGLIRSN